jgi:hypothetical protein
VVFVGEASSMRGKSSLATTEILNIDMKIFIYYNKISK